jgi:hypothetical protein
MIANGENRRKPNSSLIHKGVLVGEAKKKESPIFSVHRTEKTGENQIHLSFIKGYWLAEAIIHNFSGSKDELAKLFLLFN